jgi:glutamine synthetase adenylyltransferase
MRARVEHERGSEADGRIAFKTGPGGLMDVDFLAAGGTLERGGERPAPPLPSNAAMLRTAAPGDVTEQLLGAYDFLRRVEARARFVAGRAIEHLEPTSDGFAVTAALLDAGSGGPRELLRRIAEARRTLRAAWRRVIAAGSITAL